MNIRTLRITLAAQALLIVWLALPQAAMAAFTDNGNGTVTDTVTGLMWDQCSQGQSTTTTACDTGSATTMNWATALTAAVTANTANYKGHNDWRLPNKNELESIVKMDTSNPAIDTTAFPNTPNLFYWSSTTYTPIPALAWFVDFNDGYTLASFKPDNFAVRLVRSGQSLGAFDALAPAGAPPAPKMPPPTGPTAIPGGGACTVLGSPVVSNNPLSARPLGEFLGGGSFYLTLGLGPIAGLVDIYVVAQLPNGQQLMLNSQKQWLPFPPTAPFLANTQGPVMLTDVFNHLFTSPSSAIPPGAYLSFVVMVPAGTNPATFSLASSAYYLWCASKNF